MILRLLMLLFYLNKLFLEKLNLLGILPEKSVFGVFVHFRLIFDPLGPVSIAQGAESFLIAGLGW